MNTGSTSMRVKIPVIAGNPHGAAVARKQQ
jgi:hypothetical protein